MYFIIILIDRSGFILSGNGIRAKLLLLFYVLNLVLSFQHLSLKCLVIAKLVHLVQFYLFLDEAQEERSQYLKKTKKKKQQKNMGMDDARLVQICGETFCHSSMMKGSVALPSSLTPNVFYSVQVMGDTFSSVFEIIVML